MSVSFGPKWGGGGNPLSGGPATPSQPLNFNVATFNARRLWLSDHSVHDGFHMLVNLLTDENVEVLCVQEVLLVTSRASLRTNLSHMMVPPVPAGAKRVSCSGHFLVFGPNPILHFAPIFVHPLFPVFEPHIQKWVIFVRRRPCVCDTFSFESLLPPASAEKRSNLAPRQLNFPNVKNDAGQKTKKSVFF